MTSPTISSFSPANDETEVAIDSNIILNFSETVTSLAGPKIYIKNASTDSVFENMDVTQGGIVWGHNTTQIKIDPVRDLIHSTTYYLQIDDDAFYDSEGNYFAGISDKATYSFSTIDLTAPTVSGVTSTSSDQSYIAGENINLTVTFSESVNVLTTGGTPTLELETGSTDRNATYSAGSGTSSLTFTYEVQAGDTSEDLDYTSTSALSLNGGTIKDSAGNDATLTLESPGASGSLASNQSLAIDTTAPTVSGVTSMSGDMSYIEGEDITLAVTLSEAVNVLTTGGTPTLELETGSTNRTATYISGSTSDVLVFSYVVQAGDTSTDLDYTSTSALSLNGGTIKDSAGNDANLTLASPGAAGSLGANNALVIDTTAPSVPTSLTTTSTITNDNTPTITGTADPGMSVELFDGSTSLGTDVADSSGNFTISPSSALNDGTYSLTAKATDSAGNTSSASSSLSIEIDTTSPTITGVLSTSTDGTYERGDSVNISVGFSEEVNVSGTPTLQLDLEGPTDRTATYTSGSGSSSLIFSYTVQGGDMSTDLDYTSTSALGLNGGTIKDSAGNNATLTLTSPGSSGSLASNQALVIDAPLNPTYSTSTSINVPQEGYALTTTIQTSDVEVDTTIYWSLSGTNISLSDFSDGSLTGSGTVNSDGAFTFKHVIADDGVIEGYENIDIKLFSNSDRTTQVGETESVLIRDSAVTEQLAEINSQLNTITELLTKGQVYTLSNIRDYDGNLHANTGEVSEEVKTSYKYQGLIDVNKDGSKEAIYTNRESGRWVTASVNSTTGLTDYSDYGKDGTTRVVGIYIDPLVTSGNVKQDSDHDSQRRFQNDLEIDNLIAKTSGDYDGDGDQEVYWKTNDGTAYLRSLMHADGNIQYSNYQNEAQMSNYLTSKGYESVISDII